MTCRDFIYSEKSPITRHDIVYRYKLASYPESLKKKIDIFMTFRNSLCIDTDLNAENIIIHVANYSEVPIVYIKKWLKLPDAVLFHLNNNLIQIIFDDRTEILFDTERKQVAYIGYSGRQSIYSLSIVLENGSAEVIKKFNYAKEILGKILSSTYKSQKCM